MLIEFKTLAKKWTENKERRAEEKLYKGKSVKSLTICSDCYTYYYNHSWHFEEPEDLGLQNENYKVSAHFTQCPACLQQEQAEYDMESELFVRQM